MRTTREGKRCKWEGRALSIVVEKLEEKDAFSEADWSARAFVDVRSDKNPNIWFMRAETDGEWLLSLKFRVGKGAFEKDSLTRKLALRPLKEIEEIPLFGTLPRVRFVDSGVWNEIDLKVFDCSEVDRTEFWDFLDEAVKSFETILNSGNETEEDLTPWKRLGRDWHYSTEGFYGSGDAPQWSAELLDDVSSAIEGVSNDLELVWDGKIAVPIRFKDSSSLLGKIYTKNTDFLSLQINCPKGEFETERLLDIGYRPEIDRTGQDCDSLCFRFRNKDDFNPESLRKLLKEVLEKARD